MARFCWVRRPGPIREAGPSTRARKASSTFTALRPETKWECAEVAHAMSEWATATLAGFDTNNNVVSAEEMRAGIQKYIGNGQ